MYICMEYHSILYKNKNSAYLKKSTIRPRFQAPKAVHGRPLIIASSLHVSNVDPSKRRGCYQKKSLSIVEPKVSCRYKRHKYIKSNLFYKQTHCTRGRSVQRADKHIARSNRHKGQETDLDRQAGHQCVIS